jgi:hypothetical protein
MPVKLKRVAGLQLPKLPACRQENNAFPDAFLTAQFVVCYNQST